MRAAISELEIRPGLKIRKGSIVSLDFTGDGRGFEVEVTGIYLDGETKIESEHRTFCGPTMTHDVWQYEESASLVRF